MPGERVEEIGSLFRAAHGDRAKSSSFSVRPHRDKKISPAFQTGPRDKPPLQLRDETKNKPSLSDH